MYSHYKSDLTEVDDLISLKILLFGSFYITKILLKKLPPNWKYKFLWNKIQKRKHLCNMKLYLKYGMELL